MKNSTHYIKTSFRHDDYLKDILERVFVVKIFGTISYLNAASIQAHLIDFIMRFVCGVASVSLLMCFV